MTDLKPGTKVVQPKCNHKFHNTCLKKWLDVRNICPICKQQVVGEIDDFV